MGSDAAYPEEAPVHPVDVAAFAIDITPVTNAAFRQFVDDTGYVTVAEQQPAAADYPGADPGLLAPGALVFRKTNGPVDLRDVHAWWSYVPRASWREPEGPGSTLRGREDHPVVQVAFEDAQAHARWRGADLPSESEWEYAARGGLDRAIYAWGNELAPNGRAMANTWQGEFPWQDLTLDGYGGTSPVGAFPPNGFGLYDMTGNVWEWTADEFTPMHVPSSSAPCCAPVSIWKGGGPHIPTKVTKGGSYLCAPNYCLRYRPSARSPQSIDSATCHLGFRCVVR